MSPTHPSAISSEEARLPRLVRNSVHLYSGLVDGGLRLFGEGSGVRWKFPDQFGFFPGRTRKTARVTFLQFLCGCPQFARFISMGIRLLAAAGLDHQRRTMFKISWLIQK